MSSCDLRRTEVFALFMQFAIYSHPKVIHNKTASIQITSL